MIHLCNEMKGAAILTYFPSDTTFFQNKLLSGVKFSLKFWLIGGEFFFMFTSMLNFVAVHVGFAAVKYS